MFAYLDPCDDLDNYKFLMDEFYDDEMRCYAESARNKIAKDLVDPFHARFYAEAAALAFFECLDDSQVFFDKHDLGYIHAYALLDMKERFRKEWERLK